MEQRYRVKNWAKFQHFKDRRPPWVKLYRDLLDDMEWHELDPKAAKALVMIWVIASEDDGQLPELKKLAFRLRASEKETKTIVIALSHWLEPFDIKPISNLYQVDPLETETETEVETETETEAGESVPQAPHQPEAKFDEAQVLKDAGVDATTAEDWLAIRKSKRLPLTATAWELLKREAKKAGMTPAAAVKHSCERSRAGFEASWLVNNSARASPYRSAQDKAREVTAVLTGKHHATRPEIIDI